MKNPHDNVAEQSDHTGSYLGQNLVFIVSQPRAGSTLLQRMLSGHAEIQTSAETWLMLHPAYGLRRKGISTDFRAQWAATGVREFLDNYADGEETYREGVRRFAESIYGTVLKKNGRRIFLDKTPRYTMILPELKALFPRARFILLIRNPLSVLNSELHTYVKDDWWKLSNFNPDLLDAPTRLIAARSLLGNQAIEVRYETLVTNPEQELQRICTHLSIDYEPAMLEYGDTPVPAGRMNDPIGIHRHTRASADSVQKWTALGSNFQHRHFALSYLDFLGDDTIRDLGYDPQELRTTIESTAVKSGSKTVFPWDLAITPRQRWSMRQKMAAAFYSVAQKKGTVAGLIAALAELAGRASAIVERTGNDARSRDGAALDAGVAKKKAEQ